MSRDSTSPIAKVDKGRGYYFRSDFDRLAEVAANIDDDGNYVGAKTQASTGEGRESQTEEKFRSLYLRWTKQDGQYPVKIEHTKGARQASGINRWKFPDAVSISWNLEPTDDVGHFDSNMLEVMRGLGEQPFTITSTELKTSITSSTLRQYFFQCVSNSRWAHTAQLAIATEVNDAAVSEELERLGASYGIAVMSFGLSEGVLAALPKASALLEMSDADVETHLNKISIKTIATGQRREDLDWGHLRDLQKQASELRDIFEWIARCLKDSQAYPFNLWQSQLQKK